MRGGQQRSRYPTRVLHGIEMSSEDSLKNIRDVAEFQKLLRMRVAAPISVLKESQMRRLLDHGVRPMTITGHLADSDPTKRSEGLSGMEWEHTYDPEAPGSQV